MGRVAVFWVKRCHLLLLPPPPLLLILMMMLLPLRSICFMATLTTFLILQQRWPCSSCYIYQVRCFKAAHCFDIQSCI
jgi:hypothetical protein